ncbi:MAG: GspE/PulE family protein [Thermoguttaceae bacterium]
MNRGAAPRGCHTVTSCRQTAMPSALHEFAGEVIRQVAPNDPDFATRAVGRLLELGRTSAASDLHLQPAEQQLEIWYRIDGVLQSAGTFPRSVAQNVVARLKVLAGLLTYRTDTPQEGRVVQDGSDAELRVSTFPTLYGEKAVVRFFASSRQLRSLDDLGLPADILTQVQRLLGETSGAFLATGPAGSGKTTTVYACLRHLVHASLSRRSIVSIEDPIEVAVAGVAQSQVNPSAELDLAKGLRFLMRQDPEVIMVGEIRDRQTAESAMQASLTGHLLLSTFHAGSAAEAISRLSDMGIEPYMLRSGVLGILSQRLVRRLCDCSVEIDDPTQLLGLPAHSARRPAGCPRCERTGYSGRCVLAELLTVERNELGRAVLSRCDAASLEQLAVKSGMVSRWRRAIAALESGLTSPAEIRRVLGFQSPPWLSDGETP